MSKTIADKVIALNRELRYSGILTNGFQVMNPYLDNPETMKIRMYGCNLNQFIISN